MLSGSSSASRTFPPARIERGVRHDPVEPRPERLVGTKPVERAVCVEKPFLHRVFRVFMREHDRAGDAVSPPLVQPASAENASSDPRCAAITIERSVGAPSIGASIDEDSGVVVASMAMAE